MFRDINNQTVGERLAIGAGTATTSAQHNLSKLWQISQARYKLQIFNTARIDNTLRKHLIDRVISSQHNAIGIVRIEIASKTLSFKALDKT